MLSRVLPAVTDDDYKTREDFLEIMEDVDQIREMNPRTTRSKYTTEYFEEEWNMGEE